MKKMRVAAVQFGTATDVTENLQTCLRMIDRAASENIHLVVLPEFSNHCAFYFSQDYANSVALDLDGEFLKAISDKAKEHSIYVKINVTLKKPNDKPTVSNLLYSPEGKLIARADKQVLMGNENNFCSRAECVGDIAETPFGTIGMYACADGLLMETTRLLAVSGAQLLLNSLNSFAEDEASLHIPVRAAENKVFVVAACKVDYLIPIELLEPFAAKMKLKSEDLQGAGESQIVAPDGSILAKAPKKGEAVVFADIDLTEADNKLRPDGTDILQSRRPELYKIIAEKPSERNYKAGAKAVTVAVCQTIEAIEKTEAKLIVLPELFCLESSLQAAFLNQRHAEAWTLNLENTVETSKQIIENIKNAIGGGEKFVVTSIIEKTENGFAHIGVLIGKEGVIFRQKQLHKSNRHGWTTDFGDELRTFDLPFGKLAMIIGDDSIYPESFRLAALQNAEIVACPMQIQERWETEFGLLERAAENRLSIIAASRPVESLGEFGNSLILTVGEDFTLWAEWKNRPFDGKINYPIITRAKSDDGVLSAEIFPANAENRFVSQQTDVVNGRNWRLLEKLVS